MLRDLARRAKRAVETDEQRYRRLSIPFRPARRRLEKGAPLVRFHSCWWTRLRVRAGVTPITLGAAR